MPPSASDPLQRSAETPQSAATYLGRNLHRSRAKLATTYIGYLGCDQLWPQPTLAAKIWTNSDATHFGRGQQQKIGKPKKRTKKTAGQEKGREEEKSRWLETRRLGARSVGGPKGGRPELLRSFSPSPPQILFFPLSVGVFSWNCGRASRRWNTHRVWASLEPLQPRRPPDTFSMVTLMTRRTPEVNCQSLTFG